MRGSSRAASTPSSVVCPMCEVGRLDPRDSAPVRCGSCGSVIGAAILAVLRRIAALPEPLGTHACECGHPEMRLLPDDVYRCPACGSEVLPVAGLGSRGSLERKFGEDGP